MSRLDRVIFFSKRDLMKNTMLEKAKKLLESKHDFSAMDLNDLLEFHHVHQYFENDLYLDKWTPEQIASFKQTVKNALQSIRAYLIKIVPADILTETANLEFDNRENFWILLQYFEVYKKLDAKLFIEAVAGNNLNIRYVLRLKQLVQHYNTDLRLFLMSFEDSAELLLSHYEQKNTDPSDYNFPKSLTDADKHSIISAYLESAEPNLNYVDLIRNSKNLALTPKMFLRAKQVSEKLKDQYLTEENSTKISVGATMDMNQSEPVIYENIENELRTCYGALFFDTLTTDLKLFAVFSDLFLYLDEEGLISLVNKNIEMNVFEKISMQSKNEYPRGYVFAKKEMLSLAQLGIMEHYLGQRGRTVEDLIGSFLEHFFTDYFKIEGLTFSMPDAQLSPSDKIRLLAPEMEYLLKQYQHFATEQCIDHELLQIDSTPIFYGRLPSLLNKKYIYSTHEKIQTLQYHFFDESSILADRKDAKRQTTLFKKLKSGHVRKTDFEDYQIPSLEQAIELGDLTVTTDGEIIMTDPFMVIIAGKLRKNGTISYWHFGEEFRNELDRLIKEGFLEISDRLFTADEVSYLSFYLNKKEFSNGKDLRNKYIHGSNNRDLKKQRMDYLYFLRTFILILLKLKDDVILKKHSESA